MGIAILAIIIKAMKMLNIFVSFSFVFFFML